MKNAPEKYNLLRGLGFLLKRLSVTLEPNQEKVCIGIYISSIVKATILTFQ